MPTSKPLAFTLLFCAAVNLFVLDALKSVSAGDKKSPGVIDEVLQDFDLEHAGKTSPWDFRGDVAWLKTAPARERTRYLSALKRIVKSLVEGKNSARDDIAKNFAEAQRLCNTDPRLPLAYGLYLQRIGEAASAQNVFEQSAQEAGRHDLSILQAAAMNRLMARDYRKTWTWLERSAKTLSQQEASKFPSQAYRSHLADWLGATAAWLAALPEEGAGAVKVDPAVLRAELPAGLHESFDNGRTRSERQLAELQKFSQAAAGDSAQKLKAARTKITEKLQADQTAIKEIEEAIRQQSTELNAAQKEEKSLRSEHHRLNEQRQRREEEVAELSQPRTYTDVKMQTRTFRRARMQVPVEVQRQENAKERSDRLSKLQEASTALSSAESRIATIKDRMEKTKTARQELNAHVRQQTLQERNQIAQLTKNVHSLERLRERLNQLANDSEHLAERLKSPEILLDWDIDEAAQALQASLESPANDKSAAR